MSETSLPTVSAKITGDASQLVSEFKRAETQTSVSAAKIDAELGTMATRIGRRFSLAHTSLEILRGAGIGGGFHLAEKAAEFIASYWKQAAESAKEVEKSSEHQRELVEAGLRARRNDDMEFSKLKIERSRLQRDFDASARNRNADDVSIGAAISGASFGAVPGWIANLATPKFARGMIGDAYSDEKAAEGGKLADELQRVGNAIDANVRKGDEEFSKASSQLGEHMREVWREMHEPKSKPDHVSTQMLHALQAIQAHVERSGGLNAAAGIH